MDVQDDGASNSIPTFLFKEEPSDQQQTQLIHFNDWSQSDLNLPSTEEICTIREIREILHVPKIENKHRVKIAKAIITYLQDRNPDRKLMRAEFMQLAECISEIFPTELKETYYVPFRNGHLPKGKLYDAYNNNRTRLRDAGVIRRRAKWETEQKTSNTTICQNVDVIDVSELEILKTGHYAEWTDVLAMWSKSHAFRQNELLNGGIKTTEYIDRYLVLLNEKCHELFESDFKMLHPDSSSVYQWRFYYRKVIDKANQLRDSWIKDIIRGAVESDNEDAKLATTLMLVPYILPNPRKVRKCDVQESFISHSLRDPFVDENDDGEYQQTVKRSNVETEPKLHFIGNSSKMVTHAYVLLPGLRLRYENPLKAFEVCFHCFMSMNIPYPKTCSYVWMFIQQIIFNVTTKNDILLPTIQTMINDLTTD